MLVKLYVPLKIIKNKDSAFKIASPYIRRILAVDSSYRVLPWLKYGLSMDGVCNSLFNKNDIKR
ncbi:hypothetical protein [Hanstruepera marina]|uniref:hypothetical protein n=1 Tax=Hanstruepera marina TaxID=2873265 RepID=UPI001CA6B4D7|nr:hypothetical protein [Hanstruepera marina]